MEKSEMLECLINHYTDGNKARFASMIGVKPQTLSAWISRNTFDVEVIYKSCANISADWLLSGGAGDMLRNKQNANSISTQGDFSPAAIGGNASNNGVDVAILQERIKSMQQLLEEKERTIKILMGK